MQLAAERKTHEQERQIDCMARERYDIISLILVHGANDAVLHHRIEAQLATEQASYEQDRQLDYLARERFAPDSNPNPNWTICLAHAANPTLAAGSRSSLYVQLNKKRDSSVEWTP